MTDTAVERIRDQLGSFTAKERRVARSMLANYPVAGLQTVARLAKQSGVSSPTEPVEVCQRRGTGEKLGW